MKHKIKFLNFAIFSFVLFANTEVWAGCPDGQSQTSLGFCLPDTNIPNIDLCPGCGSVEPLPIQQCTKLFGTSCIGGPPCSSSFIYNYCANTKQGANQLCENGKNYYGKNPRLDGEFYVCN